MKPGITKLKVPGEDFVLQDEVGRKASWKIFNYLACKHGGILTREAALEGLKLYDEVVEDALARPGAHPSVELLLRVRNEDLMLDIEVE